MRAPGLQIRAVGAPYDGESVRPVGLLAWLRRKGIYLAGKAGPAQRRLSKVARAVEANHELIRMVILIEDKRFWWHVGFDPLGIARAFVMTLLRRGHLQGGSTIPEQLAKRDKTISRRSITHRIRRLLRGVRITFREGKADLLIRYLQGAYFGRSAFGIERASLKYFEKRAGDLSTAECFFLAERIATPSTFRPARIKNILGRGAIRLLLSDSLYELPKTYAAVFGFTAGRQLQRIVLMVGRKNAS